MFNFKTYFLVDNIFTLNNLLIESNWNENSSLEILNKGTNDFFPKELFEKYGKSATNTGSAESQIALFTFRISHLTEHLKVNHKDYATERSLKMLVGKRRRLLDYLIKTDIERYRAIIKELGIRK